LLRCSRPTDPILTRSGRERLEILHHRGCQARKAGLYIAGYGGADAQGQVDPGQFGLGAEIVHQGHDRRAAMVGGHRQAHRARTVGED